MNKNTLFLGALALLAVGCQSPISAPDDERALNQSLVRLSHTLSVEQGVIAQKTLFPYHFVDGTASLTAIGERDLDILATHFQDRSGQMSVRRGTAANTLYQGRVATVQQWLRDAGVDATISDDLPGGEGAPSDQVILALEPPEEGSHSSTISDLMGSTEQ